VVLRYRLDEAYRYLKDDPETICIVSGGQGYNEPCQEAEVMKKYLEDKGIDSSRISVVSSQQHASGIFRSSQG